MDPMPAKKLFKKLLSAYIGRQLLLRAENPNPKTLRALRKAGCLPRSADVGSAAKASNCS